MRTSSGFRSMRPRSRLEPARAQKAHVDAGGAQHLAAQVADQRHRRQAQQPAGHQHADARRVGQRGGDQEPVRDDHELALGAQLEGQVVGRRARVEGDRLALADERGGGPGDRPLARRLERAGAGRSRPPSGPAEGAHPTARPRHQALPGQPGQVAARRHLGDRKRSASSETRMDSCVSSRRRISWVRSAWESGGIRRGSGLVPREGGKIAAWTPLSIASNRLSKLVKRKSSDRCTVFAHGTRLLPAAGRPSGSTSTGSATATSGRRCWDALREAGWGNYSLFLRDDGLLVGYVETEDFEAAQRAMAATDVNARWQSEMAAFFGERADDGLRAPRGGLPP